MLQQAEQAETAMRQRLAEPVGTVRFTAAVATAQFAMREMVADFLLRFPKVNVVGHATDQAIDIVGENFDVAIRAHSLPLPDSTLVQRPLAPAPWFLFAGSAYLDAHGSPQAPQDLAKHPALFMMRTGVAPSWRLRHSRDATDEVVVHLAPRLLSDDMVGLKQAAIAGVGIVPPPSAQRLLRLGHVVLPGGVFASSGKPRRRDGRPSGRQAQVLQDLLHDFLLGDESEHNAADSRTSAAGLP